MEDCKEETLSIFMYILYWDSEVVFRGKMDVTGVKIMYKGGFGVSNSEGLVYITRQIFHLMTQI